MRKDSWIPKDWPKVPLNAEDPLYLWNKIQFTKNWFTHSFSRAILYWHRHKFIGSMNHPTHFYWTFSTWKAWCRLQRPLRRRRQGLCSRGCCWLSHFGRVWLCATPQTAAHQAPPSVGVSRQEYRSGVPSPPLQGSSHLTGMWRSDVHTYEARSPSKEGQGGMWRSLSHVSLTGSKAAQTAS